MKLKDWCDEKRGRATLLAAALSVPPSFISQMVSEDPKKRRPIPPQHVPAIERTTAMKVRCWDLRPHDWHLIWPEALKDPDAPVLRESTATHQEA